jgi:formylglycine-generating enzyme required for sulfatase activity
MKAEGRVKVFVGASGSEQGRWIKAGGGRDDAEVFQDIAGGPEMVVVPAGSFTMGSPETEPERESWQKGTESPQHKVTVAQPFAVGRHAVTRGQFAAFVNNTGHKTEGGAHVLKGDKWELDPKGSWRNPGFAQDDSHPVACVNWDDAKAYAAWLSSKSGKTYRLLSEAEREYVARAGTTTPFWWGSSITPAQANYAGTYVYAGGGSNGEWRKATVPVGSFAANPWGLYNVHGNVWEWCEDVWHDNYNGAPTDGLAWLQGGDASRRVVRGGSWYYYPLNLRAAYRFRYSTVTRYYLLGFRLARTLNP